MEQLPNLSSLSFAEKDALIRALWVQVQALTAQVATLTARVAELEAKPGVLPKTPDNSSLPPSQGKKPNREDRPSRTGPRQGSLGRKGGGRTPAEAPDETVTTHPARCAHCQAALGEADQTLAARFDKLDLPTVAPVVTRVERYAGHCRCCGATTLAPLPEGLEPGTPFSRDIVALAMYLRFVHHVSYRRLSRLLLELFGLAISEGALEAAFRGGKPRFDAETAAILARLRRARVVGSDGRKHCFRRRARRRPRLLELGVPERRGGGPCGPPQPGRGRRRRGDGRPPPGDLGLRPLRRPARPRRGLADLPGAPAARLPLRRRGGRHPLRPAPEGPAVARRGAGPPASGLGREHPPRIPPPPRACARCGHGARSHPPPWTAPAEAVRQTARAPLHLPRPPRGDRRQQRQRARTPSHRHLPQGHRRLPLRLGRHPLRRRPLRHRHRRATQHRRLSGHPSNPTGPVRPRSGLSSYSACYPSGTRRPTRKIVTKMIFQRGRGRARPSGGSLTAP